MATSMFNLRSQMNLDSKGRKSAYYRQSKSRLAIFGAVSQLAALEVKPCQIFCLTPLKRKPQLPMK